MGPTLTGISRKSPRCHKAKQNTSLALFKYCMGYLTNPCKPKETTLGALHNKTVGIRQHLISSTVCSWASRRSETGTEWGWRCRHTLTQCCFQLGLSASGFRWCCSSAWLDLRWTHIGTQPPPPGTAAPKATVATVMVSLSHFFLLLSELFLLLALQLGDLTRLVEVFWPSESTRSYSVHVVNKRCACYVIMWVFLQVGHVGTDR
jgi:hypothetical protein